MNQPEGLLPPNILARSSLRGGEYAWRPEDIPKVIDAARTADLASIGGQLQFRLPDGGTCECYWIEVDTYNDVPSDLTWAERVRATAKSAHAQYRQIREKHDFLIDGRAAFSTDLKQFEERGGDVADALWFVWYVEAEPNAVESPKDS
jgi:hypothetical protein